MESLTSPKVLKKLLERHGFRFSKSLGQNFLIDENILHKIIQGACLQPDDCVLEVGPGVGTLTRELAQRAQKVVAVEIDKALLPVLEETLGDFENVKVIHGDILEINLPDILQKEFGGRSFKVAANLPYYITTPIIMNILEEGLPFETIVVMIQKEVADRMLASPGTKNYGALSVGVQYYAEPRMIGKVPSTVFMPPPKVDSMVIALDKKEKPEVDVKDRGLFFRVVKAAFSQRRKTLLNALSANFADIEKSRLVEILEDCGINPGRRGETLDMEEFARLANYLGNLS